MANSLRKRAIYILICSILFVSTSVSANTIERIAVSQNKQKEDTKEHDKEKKRKAKEDLRRSKKVDKILKKYKMDTITIAKTNMDSIKKNNPIRYVVDSLSFNKVDISKVNRDSIFRQFFTDTLVVMKGTAPQFNSQNALSNVRELDSLLTVRALMDRKLQRAMGIKQDTIKLLPTTLISLAVPGFAQLQNRDYWKIPVLYGSTGGFIALGAWANSKAQTAKFNLNEAIGAGMPKGDIDILQKKYNAIKNERLLFLGGAMLSYLYFLGDGIYNYQGNAKAPAKAALLGLFVPGGGQFYNKSYWKIPIYYGALAALGYVVNYNNNGLKRYNKAYELVSDGDPGTIDEFGGRYSAEQLKKIKDQYRRTRDLSIFYTCGVYLLGVIEAYVDASFKSFDVTDDLAFKIRPTVGVVENIHTPSSGVLSNAMIGVSVDMKIKTKKQ